MIKDLFYFLIFPGLVFSGIIGGFFSWFDRKITARVQFRQGPPLLQPLYDFVKLLLKETILPKNGSPTTFILAPVFALFGAVMVSVFILLPAMGIETGFNGDLIVIIYLLNIPSLMYIIGAMASGNPLASVGASREMKLILSYEVPFLLVLLSIVIKSGMSIKLTEIIAVQSQKGAFIGSVSGIIGFIVSSFLAAIFFSGLNVEGIHILWSFLKVLVVVLLITLIRNTNPRVRIKQAMRFFWIWMNLLAIASVVLAILGL
ncbi:MAG: hypothetical protein B6D62_04115 [Candidatus Cloacimonas sp. 4484_275]|nr:MAG: hypothetical protein B6D62_04115 [Candidatus Cloacimonas sp. 4484_275]